MCYFNEQFVDFLLFHPKDKKVHLYQIDCQRFCYFLCVLHLTDNQLDIVFNELLFNLVIRLSPTFE